MKYLILFFALFSFTAFSQDVIIKKNGDKIDAKVVEITTTTIKYRSWTQQDGPLRNIEIKDVKEVIYDDGTWDNFEDAEPPSANEDIDVESINVDIDVEDPRRRDPIMKNGLSIELLIGYGTRTIQEYVDWDPVSSLAVYQTVNQNNLGIALKLSNRWYFGKREKWLPGLQVNWLRFGTYINDFDDLAYGILAGPKLLSPVNVGMSNIFKFNDKLGLEANITTGFNLDVDLDQGEMTAGLAITPEVKLRFKKLAFGIEYMRVQGLGEFRPVPGMTPTQSFFASDWNNFSVSAGIKF